MAIDTLAAFDPTPYLTAPQLPFARPSAVLAKALSNRLRGDAPPYLVSADQAMQATTEEAETAMVVRLRETNALRVAADLNLDNAVDGVVGLARDRLSRAGSATPRPGSRHFLVADPKLDDRLRGGARSGPPRPSSSGASCLVTARSRCSASRSRSSSGVDGQPHAPDRRGHASTGRRCSISVRRRVRSRSSSAARSSMRRDGRSSQRGRARARARTCAHSG